MEHCWCIYGCDENTHHTQTHTYEDDNALWQLFPPPYMFQYNIGVILLLCRRSVQECASVCACTSHSVCVAVVMLYIPCRSQCSPLVSLDVHLIPVSYWQLRSGMPADNRNKSRHACITVWWAFSWISHDSISANMIRKVPIHSKCYATRRHSRPDESVSPSLVCPTETFLVLRVIKWNYHHMTEAPNDISSL